MNKGVRRMFHHPHWLGWLFCLALLPPAANSASMNCIHEAAHCFQINPLIIKAIIWQESGGRQGVVRTNANRSQDVGLMQINSIHFITLGNLGVSEQELRDNSCINIFSGTYILHQAFEKYGYSWSGIGYYHSSTPHHHNRYLNRLLQTLRNEIRHIEAIHISSPLEQKIKSRFIKYCVASV